MKTYVIGTVVYRSDVPFAAHVNEIVQYSLSEALRSNVIRIFGEYDDPETLAVRTVYAAAACPPTIGEAQTVTNTALLRELPARGALA